MISGTPLVVPCKASIPCPVFEGLCSDNSTALLPCQPLAMLNFPQEPGSLNATLALSQRISSALTGLGDNQGFTSPKPTGAAMELVQNAKPVTQPRPFNHGEEKPNPSSLTHLSTPKKAQFARHAGMWSIRGFPGRRKQILTSIVSGR